MAHSDSGTHGLPGTTGAGGSTDDPAATGIAPAPDGSDPTADPSAGEEPAEPVDESSDDPVADDAITASDAVPSEAPNDMAVDAPAPSPVAEDSAPAAAEVAAAHVDVTITYTEIDPANGAVEIHGTGTPGASIEVIQFSELNGFTNLGTTQVAADGTWSFGTINAFLGRVITALQDDGVEAGFGNIAEVEMVLSTDVQGALSAELRDVDYSTMTGRVFGTGTPGAWVRASSVAMGSVDMTVRPDGTFDLPITDLTWGWNWILVTQEYQGINSFDVVHVFLDNPAYVAATATYTVVDAAAGTVILHGTGTPGARIEITGWIDDSGNATSVGSVDVQGDGSWSLGPIDTTVYGRNFEVTQMMGFTPMDTVWITVEFPALVVPAPAKLPVAPVLAAPAPAETRQLPRTGSDASSVAGLAALAGLLVLGGAGAVVARRRLPARG